MFSRIINLDSRPDRWEAVKHLGIQRFSAIKIDAQSALQHLCLRAQAELAAGRRVSEGIPSAGAVGCSLSHLAVWQEFLDSDDELCLVLEDDVAATKQELDDAIAWMMRQEFDIGVLGWTTPLRRPLLMHPTNPHHIIPWPRGQCFYGSHAYMLTRPAATRLLAEARPIQMQIDFYMQAQAWRWEMQMVRGVSQIRQRRDLSSDVMSLSQFCFNCEPWWDKAVLLLAATALVLFLIK